MYNSQRFLLCNIINCKTTSLDLNVLLGTMFTNTCNIIQNISNYAQSWTFKTHTFEKQALFLLPGKTIQLNQLGQFKMLIWGLRLDPTD